MKNLTEKQKKTLSLVVESGISENFYLAGETAVALKYNHRYSEDFDFFSYKFSLKKIEKALGNLPDLEVEILRKDTVIFYLNGVKFSFFEYPYKLIRHLEVSKEFYGIKLASDEDIVSMKAIAIIQRGTKKDF